MSLKRSGAIERFHRSLRQEGLSDKEPSDKYTAEDIISPWFAYYNHERLHASLKYLRPHDYLTGVQGQRLEERKKKMQRTLQLRRAENRRIY